MELRPGTKFEKIAKYLLALLEDSLNCPKKVESNGSSCSSSSGLLAWKTSGSYCV
eukprot:CAMPEP_0172537904 /NCGR_PEP_ID=MMETSP1067-20121228/9419_1 /TAXON_ID=265564 ORGANISM="Thalassiosira punctigera, Strain Tpunct2005C2" /NCGR_SAMPLE_ID=MMETSP1067 /ASSEMBLY_ACC=CAM_ASM_000444 /LENGTH=54 /DNA_ID=CAMNT_0013323303 /DNA_START=47 /DNA_END=211 /DNA_ORIENTATION=+